MKSEAFNRFLEKAVEKERLTQEEADKFREWFEDRPEVSNGLSPRARIFKAMRGRHMFAVPGKWHQSGPPWLAD